MGGLMNIPKVLTAEENLYAHPAFRNGLEAAKNALRLMRDVANEQAQTLARPVFAFKSDAASNNVLTFGRLTRIR